MRKLARSLASGENLAGDIPGDVGETEIAASVIAGEPLVIEPRSGRSMAWRSVVCIRPSTAWITKSSVAAAQKPRSTPLRPSPSKSRRSKSAFERLGATRRYRSTSTDCDTLRESRIHEAAAPRTTIAALGDGWKRAPRDSRKSDEKPSSPENLAPATPVHPGPSDACRRAAGRPILPVISLRLSDSAHWPRRAGS